MSLTQNYLKEFKERYGLDSDHFWQHKQSGQWIVTHQGVTLAAHKENITWTVENWTPPVSDPARVMVKIVATKEGLPPVQMIGECEVQQKGITRQYPFSMALKRGVDRAVLAILAPGGGLYSQVETEEWDADGRAKTAANNAKVENPLVSQLREVFKHWQSIVAGSDEELSRKIFAITSGRVLIGTGAEKGVTPEHAIGSLTDDELTLLTSELSHECEQQVNGDLVE